MNAKDIVSTARDRSIELYVENNRVKFRARKGAMTDELREQIKDNKTEITAYLLGLKESAAQASVRSAGVEAFVATSTQHSENAKWYQPSFAQQRLWFIDQLEGGTAKYNIPMAFKLTGPLDRKALDRALNAVIQRHEVLRTHFKSRNDEVYQIVSPASPLLLKRVDLSAAGVAERERETARLAAQQASEVFDLNRGPLLNGMLVQLAEQEHLVFITVHHIAFDGWSTNIFFSELNSLYTSFSHGGDNPLPSLGFQYADYAQWQRGWLQGQTLERQIDYWRQQLIDCPPVHNLPLDRPRPPLQSFSGRVYRQRIGTDLSRALQLLRRDHDVTLFMLLQTAFAVLVSRYGNDDDVLIGTPVAGRANIDTESLIGFFVNTLPLRTRISERDRFTDLLAANKQTIVDAFTHQHIPFEMLVERLQPERSMQHSPLFQLTFSVQSIAQGAAALGDVELRPHETEHNIVKFDLELTAREGGEALEFNWNYNTDLFDPDSVERLAASFEILLREIASDAEQVVSALPLLNEGMRAKLLDEWPHRDAWLPAADRTTGPALHHRFVRDLQAHESAMAVADGHEALDYRTLNVRANQLAHYMLGLGLQPEELVGVCITAGVLRIVCELAVLKAGGAIVPLVATTTSLKHGQPKLLLTSRDLAVKNGWSGERVVVVDQAPAPWPELSELEPEVPKVDGSHLAYVLALDDGDGGVNEVRIEHQSIWRLLDHPDYPAIETGDRVCVIGGDWPEAFCFIHWRALLARASYRQLAPEELAGGITADLTLLSMSALAPALERASDDFSSVGQLVLYGDVLDASSVEKILSSGAPDRIWQVSGPGQRHHGSRWHRIERLNARGIYPIALNLELARSNWHTALYALDRHDQPVPPGVAGELVFGGRWPPTAQRQQVRPSPFHVEEWLLNSGELARWVPDGGGVRLESVERREGRLRYRGRWIDPQPITDALNDLPEIEAARVEVATDRDGAAQLIAYAVPVANDWVEDELAALIVAGLKRRLPVASLPSAVLFMDNLPLDAEGGLDRARLPDTDAVALETYVAPAGELETRLCEVWNDLLDVERVGVEDDFFLLGGHSLLATRLISRIRREFDVELPLRVLFEQPTVRALAAALKDHGQALILPPITRADRTAALPLSFAQQRLWFIDQLEGGSTQYNMPLAFRLKGEFDRPAFARALATIVERHEVLRSQIVEEDGQARQVILPAAEPTLHYADLSNLPSEQREQQARARARDDAREPFDLGGGSLMRVQLLKLDEETHVVLCNMHHIASDGWSMGVFFRELGALYEAYARGLDNPLPALSVQYADYASWQRAWLQGEELDRQLEYWKQQLAGSPPVHSLPLDHSRPHVQSFNGATFLQRVDAALTKGLGTLGRRHDVTSFMLLQTAFAVLVGRFGNDRDVMVGTPIAGRTHADTEPLIGFFVNTLALRTRLDVRDSFATLLAANKRTILDAYSHQHIPFEMLVEHVRPERNRRHSPLFQISFAVRAEDDGAPQLSGLKLAAEETTHSIIKFDLEVSVIDAGDRLLVGWNYNTDLFERSSIERMASSYEQLLNGIVSDPDQAIAELPILPAGEAERLAEWNDTAAALPKAGGMQRLFEQQAERRPDAIALIGDDAYLGYGLLNRRANQLARELQQRGVGLESRVGVSLCRGPSLVISLLAIWKSGGAYVPLEASYPRERLEYMIEDAAIELVIARGARELSVPVIDLDAIESRLESLAGDDLAVPVQASNLAYVMYTSGSTGRPKGVMISHGNIARLLFGVDFMALDERLRFLHAAPVAFDASTLELWGPLLHGGSCVLLDGEVPEAPQLAAAIRDYKVDSAWLTSALFNALVDEGADSLIGLRQLAVGGEAVSPAHVQRLYELDPDVRIINGYGPTESTTFACCYPIPRDHADPSGVPIGHAIGNTEAYVLDDNLQAVPIGVVGELYLGGRGLGRGYLDRPGLTAERFLPNPYRGGERMYRTGDLCRYRGDGELSYAGRIDHQVKVRGFRIELGEVESKLLEQGGVQEAVALVLEGALGKQLVAYVVGDGECDEAQLKQALQQSLPSYMVPLAILELEGMPLTANGKLDREALPEPDWERYRSAYVAPRNATDQKLVELFERLLPVERIGIDDNFFELGGHSLLATRLISQIRREFEVEVPLRDLFDRPTVRGLGEALEARGDALVLPPIEPADRSRDLPLSFAQQRLWFIDQLEGGSAQYNMPMAMCLRGALDLQALQQALNRIVERHEVLRTVFVGDEGEARQKIRTAFELPLTLKDLSALPEQERETEVQRLAAADAVGCFDLSLDCMLRASVLRLDDDEHVLLLNMHHIASDGWSMGIFFREFNALYGAFRDDEDDPLPPLPVQYADYAHWQRSWLRDAVLQRHLGYWQRQLADLPPVHDLPLDHPRPPRQTYTGETLYRVLEQAPSNSISEFCRGRDVTLFMLLQTAFAVLISRYSQNGDVVMGTPVAGRTHDDVEDLIGFFVNNLVLRTTVCDESSFGELLAVNKQTILDAYTHQHVPFDMLVEELQPERSVQYGALYQLSFNLANNEPARMNLADLEMRPIARQQGLNKYDLQLLADAGAERLVLGLNYNTDLFEPATIAQMADDFVSLLNAVVAAPAVPLAELPLVSEQHEQQLMKLGVGPSATAWRDRRVDQWIATQARRVPDAPATKGPDGELSYRQLDEASNRLACHLRSRGIGAGDRVGIHMQRSAALMVAFLGVLKAGAAYVPLDPGNREGRVRYIIDNAGLGAILSLADLCPAVPASGPPIVELDGCCDDEWLADHAGQSCNVDVPGMTDHTAYIIYTSGSTGQPKGVAVSHANLIDYCGFALESYYAPELDGSLVVTAHAFDITAPALFLPLLRGDCVELASPGDELERLAQLINEPGRQPQGRYLIRLTPEHVRALLPLLETGRQADSEHVFVIGGSALNGDAAAELMRRFPRARVYNHYGPTETTIGCAIFELTARPALQVAVPIGRPMANTRLFVLDRHRRLLPRGAVGELYIGGSGVSQGYWQDDDKTAGSFIDGALPGRESGTLYKTGDLVRWLPSGDLVFVGRVDDQVKVRGYRIELGEIESQLNRLPGVTQAAVLAPTGASGDRQLVAYVVAENPASLAELDQQARQKTIREYKRNLSEFLPEYMVPALFVLLEEMPLTASGKINRRALPEADDGSIDRGRYVAPANETEATLCRIWEDLLHLDKVGTSDDFFAIGGHSLLATRLISRVRRELEVELSLRVLFEQPTVKGLAASLSEQKQSLVLPPIERADRNRPLPLSFAQQRLWFIDQLEGDSTQYNMPLSYPLTGEFDQAAFERAVTSIIERHEVLRTNFVQLDDAEHGGEGRQLIRDTFDLPIRYWDFSDLDVAERQHKATELARADAQASFDLSRDVMLRMHLCKMDSRTHLMLCNMHHIATDGWSMGVFFRELSALYKAYRAGQENPLPPLAIQYADYACWQRSWLHGDVLDEQLAYWREQMCESPPVHALPLDRPRPPRQTFVGRTFMRTLSPDLMNSLKALCRQHDVTLFMLLETAFAVAVGRYSNENDIVIGTPVAGRTHGDTEALIGFFVNSLPLRTRFGPADAFRDLLRSNKQTILDALTHQHIPFEMLVEHIHPERSRQHSPVFQILFALQNHERTAMDLDELESGRTPIEKMSFRTIKFDMELFAGEEAQGLVIAWRYNTDLFDAANIERMASSYEQLLNGIVSDPNQAIAELPILPAGEAERLAEWNDTAAALPKAGGMQRLFEQQAERRPDAIALIGDDAYLGYGLLNRRANQLARELQQRGVGLESRVGVSLCRGPSLVISLLAIWKSGGAYVPLEASYPRERLEYMIEDAAIELVVARGARELSVPVIDLDAIESRLESLAGDDLAVPVQASNLAYVMYTSGSTGRPKGVMISHGNIARLLFGVDFMALDERLRFLHAAPVAFDASTLELWGPLLHGGSCVLLDGEVPEAPQLAAAIGDYKVDSAWLTSALFNALVDEGADSLIGLRQLAVGGEAVSPAHVQRLYELDRDVRIINGYGPTESTTFACCYPIPRDHADPSGVPIGHAIGNTEAYVLDDNLQAVPIGVVGELYLGGRGLGRGYLDRPGLTAERFLPNPYRGGERMYRTGDLCRYRGDGELSYAGRIDHQVKVRGFRIELGEVESKLLEQGGVQEAVALVLEGALGKQLVAYVVGDGECDEAQLKQALQQSLPSYMVPLAILELEGMPLTANGKLDRESLPEPDWERYRSAYVAPRNATDQKLVELFERLLPVERIGIDDNFFELGGHSLLATRLISQIRREFEVEVPLRDLFDRPTVRGLSEALEARGDALVLPPIEPADRSRDLPLSFAQQRLWFIDQLEGGSTHYNMPMAYRLRGPLNEQALKHAIASIIERHEVLRTNFISEDGGAQQLIRQRVEIPWLVTDLRKIGDEEQEIELKRLAAGEVDKPFDLGCDLMLRTHLVRLSANHHALLMSMHHIASDGVSLGILFSELVALYRAFSAGRQGSLPALQVQYADYAAWQRRWLHGEVLERQLGYWRDQLAQLPPVHSLPLDYPRPVTQSFDGATHRQVLDPKLCRALRHLCQQNDVTLFMLVETAFSVFLARYSNADDIVIGTPIAGRTHTDVEALIGFFVNTLVLRTRVGGNPGFKQLLSENKQMILDAFTHQHVPFEMLVEELKPERSLSYSPVFQVLFALNHQKGAQTEEGQSIGNDELRMTPLNRDGDRSTTKFDLQLNATELDERVVLDWKFNTGLFTRETVENMADNFVVLLEAVHAAPETGIRQLPVLSDFEQERQLSQWNATAADAETNQYLPDLIHSQAVRNPHAIAVADGAHSLTFAELERQANRLSGYLIDRGAGPDRLIAVCMGRSTATIVAIMAVLKTGAAYVPIDPDYPVDRIAFMLQDCAAGLVLCEGAIQDRFPIDEKCVIALDDRSVLRRLEDFPDTNPPRLVAPVQGDHLAYVIYTSGSTGQPKGVMIEHAGLVNMIGVMRDQLELLDVSVPCPWGVLASLSFDASVTGLLLLATGSSVHLIDEPTRHDPAALVRYFAKQSIPVIKSVPALIDHILSELISRADYHPHIICGGDRMGDGLAARLREYCRRHGVRALNVYGPTEATINATHALLAEEGPAHIGSPQRNQRCYVLDSNHQLLPAGASGELYLAGSGLARGYLNQPELTAQSFIEIDIAGRRQERLYKTGDRVRWLPGGVLEFIERIDRQVNLHGHRIELGEIETRLQQQAGVDHALVCITDEEGGQRLVAYVAAGDPAPDEYSLRSGLREVLPAYMIPAAIIILDNFPLTANGKVDLDSLPAPDWESYRQHYVAPRNKHEKQLAAIYRDLLKIEEVGIDDDFFALGGHSLLATRLVSQIRRELNVEVPLRAVFEQATVRALAAALLDHEQAIVLPPIVAASRDRASPLSFAQQRLWFIDQLEGGSAQYNMPMVYQLTGDFDRAAFERAIGSIFERHEVLRTSFVEQDGGTIQRANECPEETLNFIDLSGLGERECKRHARQMASADARAVFDLTRDVLLRVTVLKLDSKRHVVLSNMHHIASDGWSTGIFFRELGLLYHAYRRGEENPLPPLPIQYADYARWQRDWLQGEVLERQTAYWRDQLAATPPVHSLPLDHSRPLVQSVKGKVHRYGLKGEIVGALRTFCKTNDVTLFMLLETAFALLIARYSGEQDVVVGTPVAGRTHEDTENLIGFFVNTLPLRTRVDGRSSFEDLLSANRQTIIEAFSHQHIPFEMLVEQLQPERSLQYSPVFQILFALQNNDGGDGAQGGPQLEGLSFTQVEGEFSVIKFDLELVAREVDDMLVFGWNFNSDLFEQGTIERLASGYNRLLQAIVADSSQPASALPVIAENELQRMERWNRTDTEPVLETFVHQLFEQHAATRPGAVAMFSGESRLLYGELNARANRLAHFLRSRGIGAEERVGVCMVRGPELAIAVLAIIKAGGAYVPLDPTYPGGRLAYMASNAEVSLVLSSRNIAVAGELDIETVDLDGDGYCADEFSDENLPPVGTGDSLAYVIYTSGSTGRPKGVANTHRGLLNLVDWHIRAHEIAPEHRASMLANIGFDAATWELWPYLSAGASLVTVTDEERMNPHQLLSVLSRHRVSHCFMPTPLAEQLGDDWPGNSTVQVLLVGGDRLNRYCLPAGSETRLVNHYGPTETAVVATWQKVEPGDVAAPPIGRPIDNARAYVLDDNGRRLPCGVVGELYIGGRGLARGYLGRPTTTALAFVPDPFSDQPGERLYRTGDLCRYLPDGEIEYVGRSDHQVKIRGFRIEPGEVENCLTAQPGVQEALAQVLDGALGRQLVAHVVADNAVAEEALKDGLRARLPAYMVPLAIIRVAAFPLTANGKIDRGALPEPDWTQYKRKYTAPRSATEALLVEAFQAVLPVERVGIDDDFFTLGGHSLLAVKLVGLLKQRNIAVKVKDVFARPSVRALAQSFDNREPGQAAVGHSLTSLGEHSQGLPALYCVPGIGGLGSSFIELAREGSGMFNVHAFEHRGVTGDESPYSDMGAIVDEFVADLLIVQEEGPFYLAGHSFGGCVAFEMAVALRAAGYRVRLILLDSLLFPNMLSDAGNKRASEDVIDSNQIKQTLQKNRAGRLSDEEIDTFAQRLTRVYSRHFEINQAYRAERGIDCDILLLHAQASNPVMRGEKYLQALRGLTSSGVERGEIPGGHLSMLGGESVKVLARRIDAFLNGPDTAGS